MKNCLVVLTALAFMLTADGRWRTADAQQAQPLTLQEAIRLAQQRSAVSRAARATHTAAVSRNQAFNSRLLPQLSLFGTLPSYNRSIQSITQPDGTALFLPQEQTNGTLTAVLAQRLPFTGGSLQVTSSLTSLVLNGQQNSRSWNSTPFSVSLQQDIFRPNTLGWDRREQSIRIDRDERAFLESEEDVAISTTDLFFNAYAAQLQLQNAVANAATNDTLYKINTGRYEVGRIGENDLLQSELALLRARAALDQARLDTERALAMLRIGLDMPPNLPLAVTVGTDLPTYEADSAVAAVQARRNRSTVSDSALADVQARRAVTSARLANGMGATVQATFGYNATAPVAADAYKNLLEARQFTLSVQMPLWQWGAHGEDVRAARADQDRVNAINQVSLQTMEQEARFAALQLNLARSNVALVSKADTVATRRFEVAYNRYVIGRITIDNLYIAQQEKDQALTQSAEGLRRYWLAHYRLRRATLYDFAAGQPIHP